MEPRLKTLSSDSLAIKLTFQTVWRLSTSSNFLIFQTISNNNNNNNNNHICTARKIESHRMRQIRQKNKPSRVSGKRCQSQRRNLEDWEQTVGLRVHDMN